MIRLEFSYTILAKHFFPLNAFGLKIQSQNAFIAMPQSTYRDPFQTNATTHAKPPEYFRTHTEDYRMLNKYIIWLYSARVRIVFMRFIFTYTFLTIRLLYFISRCHTSFAVYFFFALTHFRRRMVKYYTSVAERTWKIFFHHSFWEKKAPRKQRVVREHMWHGTQKELLKNSVCIK